jgi:hypothetical protein
MTTAVALPKCPKTGKKSFLCEVDAVEFEEKNRQQYNCLRQFPYACEDCTAWHLTASPPGNNSIAQMNYEPRVSKKKGLDTETVVKLRESGMVVQQIADEYKVSLEAVKYHLRKSEGKVTTKGSRSQSPLITWEQYRDRRIQLETELVMKKQQHQEAETLAQTEIDRLKQIEDRLFEERQLKIGYGPNGLVILSKYDREFDLTAEEVQKFWEEVRPVNHPIEGRTRVVPDEQEAREVLAA